MSNTHCLYILCVIIGYYEVKGKQAELVLQTNNNNKSNNKKI